MRAIQNSTSGQTTLSLTVREAQVVCVDALGRRVATLFDGTAGAGVASPVTFGGAGLPGGIYVARAAGERASATRRVTRRQQPRQQPRDPCHEMTDCRRERWEGEFSGRG